MLQVFDGVLALLYLAHELGAAQSDMPATTMRATPALHSRMGNYCVCGSTIACNDCTLGRTAQ